MILPHQQEINKKNLLYACLYVTVTDHVPNTIEGACISLAFFFRNVKEIATYSQKVEELAIKKGKEKKLQRLSFGAS